MVAEFYRIGDLWKVEGNSRDLMLDFFEKNMKNL
jgi:hypothetical protein